MTATATTTTVPTTTALPTTRPFSIWRHLRALLLVPVLAAAFGLAGLAGSASPASAAGTGSVTGIVRNNAGDPVPNGHILIVELGRQAVSGQDGRYSIPQVPFGTYEIRLSTVCKNSNSSQITVDGAETKDLNFENRFDSDQFGHACNPTSFALLDGQNVLPLTGDDASIPVSLPFRFPFYGVDMLTAEISTNGYLTFGSDGRNNVNGSIFSQGTPLNSIFVFWDDLIVDGTATVSTTTVGTAPNRVFMVEWNNVRFFGDPTNSHITFQVQLFESGFIQMGWRDLDGSLREQGNSATIGLRDSISGADADGLESSFNEPALVDSLKVQFAINHLPVAKAGADQTVASGKTFTLDGTGSTDQDGSSGLRFEWTQIAGPGSTIVDPKKAKTTVTGQAGPKTFTYRLAVTDPFGRTSTDDVTINVSKPASK